MAIVADNLILRSREHLTEESDGTKFDTTRLYALIPSALAEWVKRTEKDYQKRQNFVAETSAITILNGVADCESAINAKGIPAQYVTEADILVTYDGEPQLTVQFVNSRNRLILGGIQDRYFLTAYFDGKKMFFRHPNPAAAMPLTSFSGTMTIRGVVIPTTLTDIPNSMEGEIASILAEIARTYNTDGAHAGKNFNANTLARNNG